MGHGSRGQSRGVVGATAEAMSQRVREVMPDLEIRSIRSGEDGLVNDVIIVNEDWVFRFARTEEQAAALEREARLLAAVRPHLSIRIPEVELRRPGALVYRFIPGVPLTRDDVLALDPRARRALLEQLGQFLGELHGIPFAEPTDAEPPDFAALFRDLERELFPSMMSWARVWATDLFRTVFEGRLDLAFTPALIHGDIAPYHLCYDRRAGLLAGIIDFGDAGPGDPATDLASVINCYGEHLARMMEPVYPGLRDLLDRARFLAATLELRWALAAIRTRDPAWFLCHLGYARDAWPVGWTGE
jgi:aminoglycoside 2''-phosphotransferase